MNMPRIGWLVVLAVGLVVCWGCGEGNRQPGGIKFQEASQPKEIAQPPVESELPPPTSEPAELTEEEALAEIEKLPPVPPRIVPPLAKIDRTGSVIFLDLCNTQATDVALKHLKAMSKLEKLVLDDTQVGDAGLEHLKAMNNLEGLSLENTQVTDAGVKRLQQALPNCEIHH